MTERLYFEDSYTTSFAATVIDATAVDGKPTLVLDRTFFYPTSGGQLHDTGVLAGQVVVDVLAQDGVVRHVLAAPAAAGPGDRVEGVVDWARRYDHMQQHSGQHLLSQVFARLFEFETVAVHFGAGESTLDLDAAGVEPDQVLAAEEEANRIAYTALPITAYFITDAELGRVPVRRPPKVAGQIRIVEIAGYDYSACGGTHVRTTAEIAPLKVLRQERRKGLTRLTFKCGLRAYADYAARTQLLGETAQLFSNEASAVPGLVRAAIEQNRTLQRQVEQLTEQLTTFEIDALLAAAPAATGRRVVAQLYRDRSSDALKTLAAQLRARPQTIALLATQAGGKLTLLFARSDDLDLHMGNLLRDALKASGGNGGGRPEYAQGGAPDPAVGEEVLHHAQALIDAG